MEVPDPSPEPDFITFLFSPKPKFDCHFLVGEKSLVTPVRFGAVKMMLMAHSVVFRTELEDSELKEESDITVKDVYPDTFKTLLKYIYGHDTTGDLTFDEADNMFYAAEKYLMSNLKKKLASRLIALLTPDNVCSLLNNPACYTQLELNASITQILRYETDKVLASPQFLDVSTEGFLTILEQDGLAVPEIELWRAAIKWAKHRANTEDGKVLREQLLGVSNQLRICTLSSEQFCEEVVPAAILNGDEVAVICQSIGKKRKFDLTEFCNTVEPRKRLHKSVRFFKRQTSASCADQEQRKLKLTFQDYNIKCGVSSCDFTVVTKQSAVELLPLIILAEYPGSMIPEGWTYQFSCTVKITEIINFKTHDNSLLTSTFNEEVEYGKIFQIPLGLDGNNVVLPPNSKYNIKVQVTRGSITGYRSKTVPTYENEHMVIGFSSGFFCSNCLNYSLLENE